MLIHIKLRALIIFKRLVTVNLRNINILSRKTIQQLEIKWNILLLT
jgi:hypothetical protein